MLDQEGLALLALGYRKARFAELECRNHGTIRIGTGTCPRRRHPCPICQHSSPCIDLRCTGYSKRELPFYERLSGPAFLRRLRQAYYATKGAQRAAIIG